MRISFDLYLYFPMNGSNKCLDLLYYDIVRYCSNLQYKRTYLHRTILYDSVHSIIFDDSLNNYGLLCQWVNYQCSVIQIKFVTYFLCKQPTIISYVRLHDAIKM